MEKDFFNRILKGETYNEGTPFITHNKRSWGYSVVLDANTRIHFIDGEPSAHFHVFRTEEYIMYTGEMDVYRGKLYENDIERTIANLKEIRISAGDKLVIPPKTVHIPINIHPKGSVFIEISHGPYEESDVTRVYDKNRRDPMLAKKWDSLGYKAGLSIKDLVPLTKK